MEKDRQIHPLLVSDELINARGLMVFDDIHQMPIYHEPYVAPYFTISLNIQGWGDAEYDMRPVRFERHDIAIVHAHHALCAHGSSADYHAILLALSPRLQEEMKALSPSVLIDFSSYVWQPHFHLTDEQVVNLVHLLQLLKNISQSDIPERDTVIKHLLRVLAALIRDYRHQNGYEHIPLSPHQELFARFHHAIVEHYRTNRKVSFYANLFCLTPKHFATVIKQQTGIPASEWINNYVMIQAKTLLLYQQRLTVQQIALRLGFADQATFSRFFKANTGLSPSEYRTSLT